MCKIKIYRAIYAGSMFTSVKTHIFVPFYDLYLCNSWGYLYETKTGINSKAFSFSTYEPTSCYFHIKLFKSGENTKDSPCLWSDLQCSVVKCPLAPSGGRLRNWSNAAGLNIRNNHIFVLFIWLKAESGPHRVDRSSLCFTYCRGRCADQTQTTDSEGWKFKRLLLFQDFHW